MKWLAVLLLLANAAFFAYDRLQPPEVQAVVVAPEVKADQVRIVAAGQVTPVPAPTPTPTTASDTHAASTPAAPTPTTVAAAGSRVCLRWIVPSPDQAEIAGSRLRALGVTVQTLHSAEQAKVWVYIPPQASLEDAKKKAAELEALGIEDYFVVNNGGRWQNAVSLGVYSTREAADRRLTTLREQGVRSAVVRDRDDTLRPASFLLRDVTEAQRAALNRANAQLRGAQLSETGC
ncbi:hypothetical protein GCM10007860_34310 [Chitiniphilus shinanonensis]|uniref:SPOR domain-containing protein n=1 Tax=Chitiniphilus shinanonensis TaxID=553088 RepID=A0ABQ6BW99_9NEIS|nr:SPOR domain-containing protein [Chitiniphilus shinanonensis]GLS06255.1 hypothetical protein GCM10007860_34310 [Chitiniphilus shinanonensis]